MADGGHSYTHVKGKVVVNGTYEGMVEADFSLEKDLGKYFEQGNVNPTAHVDGGRKVSGKLTKAWGLDSGFLWEWWNDDKEYDIIFQPSAAATKLYQCSGCQLKKLGSNIKGGTTGALIIDAEFEGLTSGSTDDYVP